MKELIDLFWAKYAELKMAVETGQERSLVKLDREVEALLERIFEQTATNALEIQMQFLVAIELLKKEAEDRCCVLRHAENLQRVVERHLLPGAGSELLPRLAQLSSLALTVQASTREDAIDIAMLENLPDRAAIISPDYRYLFSNKANAVAHEMLQEQINGCHIGEFVGLHRFVQGFKDKLDRAFAGEAVEYTYAEQVDGRTRVMRCRMSPYRGPQDAHLVGALLMMEEIADRRQPRPTAA
ncbi:PAS domain-containing protein [Rhizobium sp. LjRoot30]|uniref:PAS domain-containing protein n=1 Tax=Rhizobium sp. LjRoot30 TaxID=3342320 RepID=UPI003ED0F925